MFNSSVLDIAIGLVLVYLLISVVLTSVSEAIEAILKSRAKDLERALAELFQSNTALLRAFYQHPLISGLYRGVYRAGAPATAPVAEAGAAAAASVPAAETAPPPSGAGGVPDEGSHGNLPSYIPREVFSAAVMDLLQTESGKQFQQVVDAFATRQGLNVAGTRRALEGWYDGAMDRASGWFKRRTQFRLFFLGLAIAVIGNVNSVTIAQYLAANQEAREGLVQMAPDTLACASQHGAAPAPKAGGGEAGNAMTANAAAAETNQAADSPAGGNEASANAAQASGNEAAAANNAQAAGGPASPAPAQRNACLRDQTGRLQALGLPIGWSDQVVALMRSGFPSAPPQSTSDYLRLTGAWIILIAGYLATAFAVMLGAPFWFDLLSKLMVVRSTVKPKQKSPDEPPVDGPPPAPAPPQVASGDAPPQALSDDQPEAAPAPRRRRRS
jgi:hypothetical protein